VARAKHNGNGKLEVAMALLLHNQAEFVAQMARIEQRLADYRARADETDRINAERFARIETLLLDHHKKLEELTEAVREKFGFKSPPPA
jgi:hypothetical protein